MAITISGNGSFTGATNEYTFDQSVGVAGTLTYEDVTDIDAVGIITAQSGIRVTGGSVGIGSLTPAGKLDVDGNVRIFDTSSTTPKTLRITNSNQTLFLGVEGAAGGQNIVGTGAYDGTFSVNGDFALSTNNGASSQIFVHSGGDIGIGTVGGTYTTQINDTAGSCTLQLTNATIGSGSGDGSRITASTSGILYIENQENNSISFSTNGSERASISNTGLLGISGGIQVSANITPTSGGGVEIFKPNGFAGQVQAFDRTNGRWLDFILKGAELKLFAGGSHRVAITSEGSLLLKTIDVRIGSDVGAIEYGTSTNNSVRFYQNDLERMRIDSNGLVGINTTPGTLLEIAGQSGKEATVTFNRQPVQGTNGGVIGELLFENNRDSVAQISVKRESAEDDAFMEFATQPSGGGLTERMRIDASGRVILPSASPGIAFDGNDTSGSTVTSKSLDDYEEGTWTVTCGNSITLNSSNQTATYTKVGRQVTVTGQIRVLNNNSNANLFINNLPFNSAVWTSGSDDFAACGSVRLYQAGITGSSRGLLCVTGNGSSDLYFNEMQDNAADIPVQATTNGFYMFNITYFTA